MDTMVNWISAHDELYSAARSIGARDVVHLELVSLGELGWDWHVWDMTERAQDLYGLADTLEEAKAKAERALADLTQQLSRVT